MTPSERAQFLRGAIATANHAQGRAIDRVIAANKLGRTLFNDEDSPH